MWRLKPVDNTSSYNNYADIIPQSYVPKSWKLEDLVSLMNYSEKVQNKCVVVIEDFKMVEEVIDVIVLPQALPKLFYDPVTPLVNFLGGLVIELKFNLNLL